jgi:hypothetical protein
MNAYSFSELRSAAASRTQNFSGRVNSINEARARHLRTAFLCHSHKDRDLALGLKATIESQGGTLYIDWLDEEMPETPNRQTAQRIKDKIVECDLFMFLATHNSMVSRWCPWEIGYADGKKIIDAIVIVPTKDDTGRFHGNEYLQLYRRLEPATFRVYGQVPPPTVIRPGDYAGVPVQQL